ncbi:MFS general substrate transporter [Rhizoctonia solani]|uniref:MFS general substrate transporter n=1 Tax=Rhizoctonia solani TaxID=456999 RepID=A0A8H7IGB7_9AGAM|nr:MFS general substrate transporter [Rhizoctonia solani]
MPDTSEAKVFFSSEEHGIPLLNNVPNRAFSIDSNASAQSDRTIRPLPRTSSPPALEDPPKPILSHKRSKASPWWLIPIVSVTALIYAGTIAPRTELLVKLACNNLHPGWDLVSNPIDAQKNGTLPQSNSHPPRGFPERLYFVERDLPIHKRSQITTPGTSTMCSDDEDVQKEVAKLNTAISLVSGVLSVLTTGWWTQLSDRVGRIRVLTIGAFSGLMVDAIFVGVVLNSDKLPGGYWLLVVSNMIDGVFGGFSTPSRHQTPISATVFPLLKGKLIIPLVFIMVRNHICWNVTWTRIRLATHQFYWERHAYFYIAVAFDLIYGLYVGFILPESMDPEHMKAAREAKRRSKESSKAVSLKGLVLNLIGVVAPFTMFFPRIIQRSGGRKKYEWNATFIGIAYSLHAVNSGSFSFKYQYAIKAFGWSSTQMGNWLSLLGFTRALHLTVLLPLILKAIHWVRERRPPTKPISESDKAQSVDLLVARASVGVDITSYSASALVTTSSAFLGTTTILSFGGGYPPAIQSLALALTQTSKTQDAATVSLTSDEPRFESTSIDTNAPDDTGRLLGAMSVVYTLCSQIFGPSLFGALFVATVVFGDKEDDVEYVLLNNMED